MKFKKYHFQNITFWFAILSVTLLCAMGKLGDDLYLFLMGLMVGVVIGNWKEDSKDKDE